MAHMRLKGQRPFLCESALVWCCASLALGLGILWGETKAWAQSDYEIINTGIKGGGCWYDDTHFIVVKGQQPAPGQEFEVEGLYYLDPSKPKDLRRIDLSPIEPSLQRHIRDVTCQDQTILFHVLTTDRKQNQLYTLKIEHMPEVLAEKQDGFVVPRNVSVRNRYVLDVTRVVQKRGLGDSSFQGQAKEDCPFTYLQAGYHVACLRHDRGRKRMWFLKDAVFSEYIWDETVRVGKEGSYQWLPNPDPPLRLVDGTEIKQGFTLQDLKGQFMAQVKLEQPPYQVYKNTLEPNPQGTAVYAACSKKGDHGERRYTMGGRICRILVNATPQVWEEVFAVQNTPRDLFDLQYLDVNEVGDVVMIDHGHQGAIGLWKYTAVTRSLERLAVGPIRDAPSNPQLSPSGSRVSFSREGGLLFAVRKGVAQGVPLFP